MKFKTFLILPVIGTFLILLYAKPSYNGSTSGCSGGSCHASTQNLVTVKDLGEKKIEITVSGVSSGQNVAGELVNESGNVVASTNQTSSNPFTLTAPSEGTFKVNAGYAVPSLKWGTTTINVQTTALNENKSSEFPEQFRLYNNHPNPFNMETIIGFRLEKKASTKLSIYNINGQLVRTLINEEHNPGYHSVKWDGTNDLGNIMPSGTYICELISNGEKQSKKILLVK